MNKRKILNDPIYGFLSFKFDVLYDLIDHPYFQRLRRISQLGLSSYVYPGGTHTRFHHALGALHLMTTAIHSLRSKGVEITEDEEKGVCIAILLHDIGHGPFSHALEGVFLPFHHEELSLAFMHQLNKEFDGALNTAIEIFENKYSKPFLNQLVSSQLDMDRMDYLSRDSYYTGVAEGIIGYARIIKMLHVIDDELVIEEKGIYSIEKFLIARRIMYLQVYLHKTVISAEQMLKKFFLLAEDKNIGFGALPTMGILREAKKNAKTLDKALLNIYADLDDIDIIAALKLSRKSSSKSLSFLANAILDRNLFKIIIQKKPFEGDLHTYHRLNIALRDKETSFLTDMIIAGKERNQTYEIDKSEIKILRKDGSVELFSQISDFNFNIDTPSIYFLCYPRIKC